MENEREDREPVPGAVAEGLSVLTVQDVAALPQVKTTWVYDRVAAGDFPVIRVGRQLRFRPADIREYLEARTQPARSVDRPGLVVHEAKKRVGRPRCR